MQRPAFGAVQITEICRSAAASPGGLPHPAWKSVAVEAEDFLSHRGAAGHTKVSHFF